MHTRADRGRVGNVIFNTVSRHFLLRQHFTSFLDQSCILCRHGKHSVTLIWARITVEPTGEILRLILGCLFETLWDATRVELLRLRFYCHRAYASLTSGLVQQEWFYPHLQKPRYVISGHFSGHYEFDSHLLQVSVQREYPWTW